MPQKQFGTAFGMVVTTIVGIALFIGGYLICVDPNREAYGWVLFILVPGVVGFAIGVVGRRGLIVAVGIALTTILTLGVFVAVGFEGWICCLMALPLIVAPMVTGAILGYIVHGRFLRRKDQTGRNTLLLLLMCPFLMAAANEAEKPWRGAQRSETFSSEVLVPTSPGETWEMLVRMPEMKGAKPFLLQIGLPVPDRCTLDAEVLGGHRTCYFDQGAIEMDVTEWRKPDRVAFEVTRSTLPGRRWLSFVDASYELIPEENGTRVIRKSTIASRLYPRWYWRPFEHWGVVSEHEFVLSSLEVSTSGRSN
jgi:hypothetical protein